MQETKTQFRGQCQKKTLMFVGKTVFFSGESPTCQVTGPLTDLLDIKKKKKHGFLFD